MELIIKSIGLIFAFFLGAVIIWLWAKQKFASQIVSLQTQTNATKELNNVANTKIDDLSNAIEQEKISKAAIERTLIQKEVENKSLEGESASLQGKFLELEKKLNLKVDEFNETNKILATQTANNESLTEKLSTQKQEIIELSKKFNTEFENIANKIFEEKSEKFANVNKVNLESILKPLGENLESFKKKVDEVYDKEAKERFSLGEKVKELADLNQVISQEARNLTNALKTESKTQGGWGEMILESILEKSGLRKNKEYFMEHQLLDNDGNPIKSDIKGTKMRPDAVIKYPDQRSVIIDSKTSLNAFLRYMEATDTEVQKKELKAHVVAVKNHIDELNKRGYDDYNKALDFVMMFIPSEPAYIAAMQGDSDLWSYAYDKRILLMNPTNFIISLKLIEDLWKREYQNRNAIDIATRGANLYNKFVGFTDNLKKVGKSIESAQIAYEDAYKQLSTGDGNLVRQTEMLKALGLKTTKKIDSEFLENNQIEDKTNTV